MSAIELLVTPVADGAFDFFSDDENSPIQETPTQLPVPTPFQIDSEDRANWYLRSLGNIAAEKERVKANSAKMLADLTARENGLKSRHESDFMAFCKAELIRRKSKKKSLPLFQGVVSFKTQPASYSVCDPEAALVYARTFLPDLIEQKPVLNTSAYTAASRASRETETLDEPTGELVPGDLLPGTQVKPSYESMSIKFVAPVGAIDSDDAEGESK